MTETSLASIIAHVVVGTGDPNKTLLNLIKNLATQLEKLQSEVTELKAENNTLRENNNRNNNTSSTDFWKDFDKNTAARNQINSMVSSEKNNVKRKENNLIITEKKPTNNEPRKLMTGITQEAVKIEVDKILTEIGMEKHKETVKASRKEENGRIRLIFEDHNMKMEVLKASSKLKDKTDFKTVFINNDLTEAEAANEKNLRIVMHERNSELTEGSGVMKYGKHKCSDGTERKWWWGIRGGELRRIYGPL